MSPRWGATPTHTDRTTVSREVTVTDARTRSLRDQHPKQEARRNILPSADFFSANTAAVTVGRRARRIVLPCGYAVGRAISHRQAHRAGYPPRGLLGSHTRHTSGPFQGQHKHSLVRYYSARDGHKCVDPYTCYMLHRPCGVWQHCPCKIVAILGPELGIRL
jgi:hypothetical protein